MTIFLWTHLATKNDSKHGKVKSYDLTLNSTNKNTKHIENIYYVATACIYIYNSFLQRDAVQIPCKLRTGLRSLFCSTMCIYIYYIMLYTCGTLLLPFVGVIFYYRYNNPTTENKIEFHSL